MQNRKLVHEMKPMLTILAVWALGSGSAAEETPVHFEMWNGSDYPHWDCASEAFMAGRKARLAATLDISMPELQSFKNLWDLLLHFGKERGEKWEEYALKFHVNVSRKRADGKYDSIRSGSWAPNVGASELREGDTVVFFDAPYRHYGGYGHFLIHGARFVPIVASPQLLGAYWGQRIDESGWYRKPSVWSDYRKGYTAVWEVRDGKLWLTAQDAYSRVAKDDCDGDGGPPQRANAPTFRPVPLGALFPRKARGGRVLANWYTGTIRIPEGRVVAVPRGGAPLVHQRAILLHIRKGIVDQEEIVHNRAQDAPASRIGPDWVEWIPGGLNGQQAQPSGRGDAGDRAPHP